MPSVSNFYYLSNDHFMDFDKKLLEAETSRSGIKENVIAGNLLCNRNTTGKKAMLTKID